MTAEPESSAPAPRAHASHVDPPAGRPRSRHRVRNALLTSGLVVALGAGGVGYWALDRFVIDHVQIAGVSAYEASLAASAGTASGPTDTATDAQAAPSTATVTDTSYVSDDATIKISTVVTGSGDGTVTYYVADVTLADATVLRSAFAEDSFGTNIVEATSDIAADNGAIFAVNGDYYGFRDSGIVIRNGVAYRDAGARIGLAFYRDGHVEVYDETATSAQQLVDDGVWNTLSFGPAIVENGAIVAGIDAVEVDTNFGNHSIQGDQPRTGVGIIDDDHLVFVVVDGRSPGYSEGMTLTELAQIMVDLGATTAYNLDGGGSSTMYFNGGLVNDPLGTGQERGTSDILYVAG